MKISPPQGLANLTALGNVITWQRAEYDFKFQKLEYDTDLPCLVLSEGRYAIPHLINYFKMRSK